MNFALRQIFNKTCPILYSFSNNLTFTSSQAKSISTVKSQHTNKTINITICTRIKARQWAQENDIARKLNTKREKKESQPQTKKKNP
jgi:hypothetical protein